MATKRARRKKTSLLLGVGLDGTDGEKRITRGRDFVLVGGSESTHASLQERAVLFDEELRRRGKRLADVDSLAELEEIADRAWR